jgi:asparagine synthase (glutamine-hydrolysing)
MSCIAGLIRFDGQLVEPRLIERMLSRMRERAPHGTQVHCGGNVGFGNDLLRTDRTFSAGPHPIAQDSEVWVTADARIDARADLVSALRRKGRQVIEHETAAGLILHAWRAFGSALLDHLIGDFAFAIWDRRTSRLVCARDHFGIRPFYYVQTASLLAFASYPDALLTLPDVSTALDEISVADFLLFGTQQDPHRSMYRSIACLPPASTLAVSANGTSLRRYWSLPERGATRFRKRSEYVEEFGHLLKQAVTDRLPAGPVAVQLSGGMDSSSIAAIAADRSKASGHLILAVNASCKSLIPEDEEGELARCISAHLAISLFQQDMGAYGLYDRASDPALRTGAPIVYPKLAAYDESLLRVVDAGAHVLLSGHGGDAVLAPSNGVIPRVIASRKLGNLPREVFHHLRHAKGGPGLGIRGWFAPKQKAEQTPTFPDWIDGAFAARVDLRGRWQQGWDTYYGGSEARYQLQSPWLCRNFEAVEPLARPVVLRHPFYDLRLVTFALGLPEFMLAHKRVMREAMRKKLPLAILKRPKAGLAGDMVRIEIAAGKLPQSLTMSDRGRYPEPWCRETHLRALERHARGAGAATTWSNVLLLAPLAFRIWMSNQVEVLTR